jgi:hypothetical protein
LTELAGFIVIGRWVFDGMDFWGGKIILPLKIGKELHDK